MTEPASDDTKGTVVRVLSLLRCFADGPADWTPSELAAVLHLPRSTVHRLLQLLRSQGLVDVDPASRRYGAGTELYRFGSMLAARMPYTRIARPILDHIVGNCDETAVLGLYQPTRSQMIFAATAESTKPMRYVLHENVLQSLLWGATGRAILAFLEPAEVNRAVGLDEPSPARATPIDRAALDAELATIRARGYAVSRGQRIPSAVGIAAPFFSASGRVLGDIAITIPDFRFDGGTAEHLIELVVSGASQMSNALGYSGTTPGRSAAMRIGYA